MSLLDILVHLFPEHSIILEAALIYLHLTFQYMKLTGSTTVGWTISRPGKIPQVTALGCMSGALVRLRPCV